MMHVGKRPRCLGLGLLGLVFVLGGLMARPGLAQNRVSPQNVAQTVRPDTPKDTTHTLARNPHQQDPNANLLAAGLFQAGRTTGKGAIDLGPCADDNLCHEQDRYGYPVDCSGP